MDKDIFDKLVMVNDVVSHKDNPEESEFVKSCYDILESLKMFNDAHFAEIMGVSDTLETFMILKRFSDDLKPYYIKYLMLKGANSKED